jgi:hypothetical protein
MPALLRCMLGLLKRVSPHPQALEEFADTFADMDELVPPGHRTNSRSAMSSHYTHSLLQRVTTAYAQDYALFQLPVPVV